MTDDITRIEESMIRMEGKLDEIRKDQHKSYEDIRREQQQALAEQKLQAYRINTLESSNTRLRGYCALIAIGLLVALGQQFIEKI